MSYQQISINPNKLEFIQENYQDQITALELFFKDTHLKESSSPFSLTLSTIALYYSTLRWFDTSTCIAISVDLLPSSL